MSGFTATMYAGTRLRVAGLDFLQRASISSVYINTEKQQNIFGLRAGCERFHEHLRNL